MTKVTLNIETEDMELLHRITAAMHPQGHAFTIQKDPRAEQFSRETTATNPADYEFHDTNPRGHADITTDDDDGWRGLLKDTAPLPPAGERVDAKRPDMDLHATFADLPPFSRESEQAFSSEGMHVEQSPGTNPAPFSDPFTSGGWLKEDFTVQVPPPPTDDPGHSRPVPGDAYAGVETDVDGLPWDERIHAGTKTKKATGQWKAKRNVDPATVKAVTDELRQVMGLDDAPTPPPVTPPADAPTPPPVTPPAAAAGDAPTDFMSLVQAVGRKQLTADQINGALQKLNPPLPSFQQLANRPDLIGPFWDLVK